MFQYVSDNNITLVWLENQNLGTYQVNTILRYLSESVAKLNSSCEIYLNDQIPLAPPTKSDQGITDMIAIVDAKVTTLTTD